MMSPILQLTICKGAVTEAIVFAQFQRFRVDEERRIAEYATCVCDVFKNGEKISVIMCDTFGQGLSFLDLVIILSKSFRNVRELQQRRR